MTIQQRQKAKNWLSVGLTSANLIFLITLSFNIGSIKAEMQNDINSNRESINKHLINQTLHMPFEKKIEVFVPRVELDQRLKNIEKLLDKIDSKINE